MSVTQIGLDQAHSLPAVSIRTQAYPSAARRPVSTIAANDEAGQAMTRWAMAAGRQVPDDIALLGVDNDELVCETSPVQLSSIAVPGRRIGQISVVMLEELLRHGASDPSLHLLPPVGVVHRRSTDTQVAADPAIAEALRFIRDHAHERITVNDVLSEVMISRRKLEGGFKRLLGRSPGKEIRRVRIEQAKALLGGSNLPLPDVAGRYGLGSRAQLNRVFKALAGHTPAAFRREHR